MAVNRIEGHQREGSGARSSTGRRLPSVAADCHDVIRPEARLGKHVPHDITQMEKIKASEPEGEESLARSQSFFGPAAKEIAAEERVPAQPLTPMTVGVPLRITVTPHASGYRSRRTRACTATHADDGGCAAADHRDSNWEGARSHPNATGGRRPQLGLPAFPAIPASPG